MATAAQADFRRIAGRYAFRMSGRKLPLALTQLNEDIRQANTVLPEHLQVRGQLHVRIRRWVWVRVYTSGCPCVDAGNSGTVCDRSTLGMFQRSAGIRVCLPQSGIDALIIPGLEFTRMAARQLLAGFEIAALFLTQVSPLVSPGLEFSPMAATAGGPRPTRLRSDAYMSDSSVA